MGGWGNTSLSMAAAIYTLVILLRLAGAGGVPVMLCIILSVAILALAFG